jgi:hypothetical protein
MASVRPKRPGAPRRRRPTCGPAGGSGGLLPRLWHTPRWVTLMAVAVAGCALGWLYPNPSIPPPWGEVQSATGWTYTAAWSLSFYPQAGASVLCAVCVCASMCVCVIVCFSCVGLRRACV